VPGGNHTHPAADSYAVFLISLLEDTVIRVSRRLSITDKLMSVGLHGKSFTSCLFRVRHSCIMATRVSIGDRHAWITVPVAPMSVRPIKPVYLLMISVYPEQTTSGVSARCLY